MIKRVEPPTKDGWYAAKVFDVSSKESRDGFFQFSNGTIALIDNEVQRWADPSTDVYIVDWVGPLDPAKIMEEGRDEDPWA